MIHPADRKLCSGCCTCAEACPVQAITMSPDPMGFLYPVIDPARCTDCGLCARICPFEKARPRELDPAAEHFYLFRNENDLEKSQSGGLSDALASRAISLGMVVYGAAMEDDFSVRHIRVEKMEDAGRLRLSKYVQSNMRGIPTAVLEDLKAGRKVLFTGTPCQCAGIAAAASRYRENLILCDIICHGVPSPKVWADYIAYRKKKGRKRLLRAVFRDPAEGWHRAVESYDFSGKKLVTDEYSYLYYRCLMDRPSCLQCPYSSMNRPSDITMGDAWGIEKTEYAALSDDERGMSLAIVHTPKGASFFIDTPFSVRQEVEPGPFMQQNLRVTTYPDPEANSFENDYIRKGFRYVNRKYGKVSLRFRIRHWIGTWKGYQ